MVKDEKTNPISVPDDYKEKLKQLSEKTGISVDKLIEEFLVYCRFADGVKEADTDDKKYSIAWAKLLSEVNKLKQQEISKEQQANIEINKDILETDIQLSREQFILDNLMDTVEDKFKFVVLRSLSGRIHKSKDLMFSVIFTSKLGRYHPIVVLSNGEIYPITDRYKELLGEIAKYEQTQDEKNNPTYSNKNSIPDWEKYQYFKYMGTTYKFSFPISKDITTDIQSTDNNAINYIMNNKIFSPEIYDDVVKNITDFYYHPSKYEYDVMGAFAIESYIYEMLGRTIYLIFYGKQGTGKTYAIEILRYLMFNGYITGKGTIPSTVRKIHNKGISLCQDEFEKMDKGDTVKFVAVCNSGFNPNKHYSIVNMAVKDITKQDVEFRTFCPKTFTANSLYIFDASFLDRCYIVNSVKAGKPLKDIYQLSQEDVSHLQEIRNKLFIYCINNWEKILKDIDETKKELESQGVFGRETDKNSIILGIIKHFKGKEYSDEVKKYIKEKAPLEKLEKTLSMEEIILTEIVSIYNDTTPDERGKLICVEAQHLHLLLCQKMGYPDPKTKGAPHNRTPGNILRGFGLLSKLENKQRSGSAGRWEYRINIDELKNVLKTEGYNELLERITTFSTSRTFSTFRETSESTESNECTEWCLQEHKHPQNFKIFNTEKKISYEFSEKKQQKLAEICEKQAMDGKLITFDFLNHHFCKLDIDKAVGLGFLIRLPDGNYKHKDLEV